MDRTPQLSTRVTRVAPPAASPSSSNDPPPPRKVRFAEDDLAEDDARGMAHEHVFGMPTDNQQPLQQGIFGSVVGDVQERNTQSPRSTTPTGGASPTDAVIPESVDAFPKATHRKLSKVPYWMWGVCGPPYVCVCCSDNAWVVVVFACIMWIHHHAQFALGRAAKQTTAAAEIKGGGALVAGPSQKGPRMTGNTSSSNNGTSGSGRVGEDDAWRRIAVMTDEEVCVYV